MSKTQLSFIYKMDARIDTLLQLYLTFLTPGFGATVCAS